MHKGEINPEFPNKQRCSRSLPSEKVIKYVPDYYHGKRIGPGELRFIKNLDKSDEYEEYSTNQRMISSFG